MNDVDKAAAYLNDSNSAIWAVPPELLPDYVERHPERAKGLIDSTGRVAEIAAELGQWDAMQRAIKFLIAAQQAVLDWWGNHVLRRGQQISHDRGRFPTREAEQIIGFSDSAISRWRGALGDPEAYEDKLIHLIRRKAGLETDPNRVTPNSGEEQWYTPAQYIEAAREVMGGIDLDPASHEVAQRVVRADCWYGPADDGLTKPWRGRVWLNPPYSYPAIEQFTSKLVDEYLQGRTSQGILVTNNCTDTGWFHASQASASMLCFTKGRIAFYGPNQVSESPLQGQCFFYFGDRQKSFRRIFGAFGFCRGL